MNFRIIFLIDSLGSGGAQNQIVQMSRELTASGQKCKILYYHDQNFFLNQINQDEINMKLVNKMDYSIFPFITRLRHEIISFNPSHVISFLYGPNFYSSLIGLSILKKKPYFIVSERSHTRFLNKFSTEFILKKLIYFFSNSIMTNSFHESENLKRQFGVSPDKIFTQYNLLNLSKTTFRIKSNFFYKIIVVGKARPMKNGLTIIEAMNILKNENNLNFELHWFGEYKFKKPLFKHYVKEMNKKILKFNLQDNWVWEGEFENVIDCYKNFDALLFPTLLEGLPNVVCESLACGIPIIIGKGFDHERLVKNLERGYLINSNSAIEIANSIRNLYQLPISKYNNMQENCMEYAKNTFDTNVLVGSFLNQLSIVENE